MIWIYCQYELIILSFMLHYY